MLVTILWLPTTINSVAFLPQIPLLGIAVSTFKPRNKSKHKRKYKTESYFLLNILIHWTMFTIVGCIMETRSNDDASSI